MKHLIACALLVLFLAPALAADKSEDKAKEVAVAFQKALKDKDLDQMMKHAGAPFLVGRAGKDGSVTDKPDDVKAHLKKLLDRKDTVLLEAVDVIPASELSKKLSKGDKNDIAAVEKFLGPDGFLVGMGKGKEIGSGVLVRVKDGKAGVVGLVK